MLEIQIRDLEARVEILSGGKDEALGEMRNMVKGLYFISYTSCPTICTSNSRRFDDRKSDPS